MKNSAGIDLSDLTEAQKKMCVRLLAMNDVQFIQNQNNYIATLRVPTSQVNSYLFNQNNQPCKKQNKQQKIAKNNIQNKNIKECKQRSQKKQKSVSKQRNKLYNKQNRQQKKEKVLNKVQSSSKKQMKVNLSKKSLFKSVKLPQIPKLQILHPEVQIYIYPKRMPLLQLQELIQEIYQELWSNHCRGQVQDFHRTFYDSVCLGIGTSKPKIDQNIVNILQTINHFQHKQIGVKIFYSFLCENNTKEQLQYFLVLRALMQELVGQKIINGKQKQKTLVENTFGVPSSNSSILSSNNKVKLRWNPNEKQISQFVCQKFLAVVSSNSNNVGSVFQKLTEFMYYCEVKKGNFIMFYDLLDFMLKKFAQQCQDVTVTNLQLSYSNNDSTLNDIIAQSANRNSQRPLQTKFQLSLMPQSQLSLEPEKQSFQNDDILMKNAIEKARQMCRKMQIPVENERIIVQKIQLCIQSIMTLDKMKWVEAMDIEGNEQQLNFIQNIQLDFKNTCAYGMKITMINSLIKKIFTGPGFIKLFSKFIVF